MKSKNRFSPKARIESFRYAWTGFWELVRTEHNARIHLAATIAVLLFSWWLDLDAVRFSILILAIASVWIAEGFNTVFEIMAETRAPQHLRLVRQAKDIAAASVLIASICSLTVGISILGPALYQRILG